MRASAGRWGAWLHGRAGDLVGVGLAGLLLVGPAHAAPDGSEVPTEGPGPRDQGDPTDDDTGEDADTDDAPVVDVLGRSPTRPRDSGGRLRPSPAGSWSLGGGDLETIAGGGGDLSRGLQVLPAVQGGRLRSTLLSLHGQDPTEVVTAVEGVPLLSPRSAGVVFSRIPTPLVERVDVVTTAPSARIPGVLAGAVDLTLVEPGDSQLDGTIEVNPALVQAQVSAPLGRRGQGHALLLGARRSWLEPSLAVLGYADLDPGWRFVTQDVWGRLRVRPFDRLDIDAFVLAGSARDVAAPSGFGEVPPEARQSTVLGWVRLDAALSETVSWETRVTGTWERQRSRADPDSRDERVSRPAVRSMVVVGRERVSVRGGVELGVVQREGSSEAADPRVAAPWRRVAWRRLAPRVVDLSYDTVRQKLSGFSEADVRLGTGTDLHAGVRLSRDWSVDDWDQRYGLGVRLEPVLAASQELPTGTRLGLSFAHRRAHPRDPLAYATTAGVPPAQRATSAAVTVQQGLGEVGLVRLDAWTRRMERLMTWTSRGATGASTAYGGSESAWGVDALVGVRTGRWDGSVSGSWMEARRREPFFFGVDTSVEPAFAVPWSGQLHVGVRPGVAHGGMRLGARVQVRSGVLQTPLGLSEGGVSTFEALYNEEERLAPRWRVGLRASRTVPITDRVDLSLWLEALVLGGPEGEVVSNTLTDPSTGEVSLVTRDVEDPRWLPWLGARCRF